MNIRNFAVSIITFTFAAALCASARAARFEAGKGVANDRATGAGPNDVTFVTRGNGNAYGWRQYALPIGLTVLPWSIPNFECSVYGLRLNLGWGEYDGTYGLDAGVFSLKQEFGGISANFFGNYAVRDSAGLETGALNVAGTMRGLQIGFVNVADALYGVQIGVLNFNGSGITFPILNIGW